MKALEILETLRDDYIHGELTSDIEEAIKELEELQSRTCENCKYNKEQDSFMIFCDKEMCQDGSRMMWHSFIKDFCCNKWEVKNEK